MYRTTRRTVVALFVYVIVAFTLGSPSAFAQCVVQSAIQPNDRVVGTLSAGDCTFEQQLFIFGFVDLYGITLPSNGRLTVRMDSTELDSLLILLDTNLSLPPIAADDHSGGNGDALMSVSLSAGTYVIGATSFARETGAYTLTTSCSGCTADLAAAVLPTSRSVQVGDTATAFATVINILDTTALSCGLQPITFIPASFSYQTTDPATNALVGTPNTPVDIPAGGLQTYVFAFTTTASFNPTDVELTFDCSNTNPAPVTTGLNTLLLSASNTPVPDIVASAVTPTGDGTVRLPGVGGSGAFAVASVNVGSTGTITATPGFGGVSLPVALSICETNPATGACLGTAAAGVTTTIAAAATPTFAIFATATGDVAFNPASNRVSVSFADAGRITRGSTSVAVTTVP